MHIIIGLVVIFVALYCIWDYLFYIIGGVLALITLGATIGVYNRYKDSQMSETDYLAKMKQELLEKKQKENKATDSAKEEKVFLRMLNILIIY